MSRSARPVVVLTRPLFDGLEPLAPGVIPPVLGIELPPPTPAEPPTLPPALAPPADAPAAPPAPPACAKAIPVVAIALAKIAAVKKVAKRFIISLLASLSFEDLVPKLIRIS
jgi:hypothetical protein